MRWGFIAAWIGFYGLLWPAACGAGEVRYAAKIQGEPAGSLVVTRAADGAVDTHFTYKDNGRGPDLRERLQTRVPQGITAYAVRGSSTFGAAIDETFEREGATGRWRSVADGGASDERAAAMGYWPLEGSPEITAQLAVARGRCLREARLPPDQALQLLPA